MKSKLKLLTAAAAFSVASSVSYAAESVNIGVPSWTGAQAIANLLKVVVETRIGGTAGLVPGNNATIFQAMDQGVSFRPAFRARLDMALPLRSAWHMRAAMYRLFQSAAMAVPCLRSPNWQRRCTTTSRLRR